MSRIKILDQLDDVGALLGALEDLGLQLDGSPAEHRAIALIAGQARDVLAAARAAIERGIS